MAKEGYDLTIRYLIAEERPQSRNLWEEAFPEDSKQFGDYYFAEKIKDNRILVLEEDARIDSMIQLNPYVLQVKGEQWKSDYLVGVATRKDRRHRGYMRRLLGRMMADMRAEGMPFCFLMPADEAIYLPFGFIFIYDQPQYGWKNPDASYKKIPVQTSQQEREAAEWMNDWLSRRYQMYAVRDEAYVERLVKEIASEHGTLDMILDGERMIGLESLWGLTKKVQRLLYAEDAYVTEVKESKKAIMARIITPDQFVSAVCLKQQVNESQKTLILQLEDPLIPENQGLWKWTLNHETSWMERTEAGSREAAGDRAVVPDLELTITELTVWLFGYEIPEAAEAFADVVQPLERVFLDEVV